MTFISVGDYLEQQHDLIHYVKFDVGNKLVTVIAAQQRPDGVMELLVRGTWGSPKRVIAVTPYAQLILSDTLIEDRLRWEWYTVYGSHLRVIGTKKIDLPSGRHFEARLSVDFKDKENVVEINSSSINADFADFACIQNTLHYLYLLGQAVMDHD